MKKWNKEIKNVNKEMKKLTMAKMPYLERLNYKRTNRRALRFAWQHEFDEI